MKDCLSPRTRGMEGLIQPIFWNNSIKRIAIWARLFISERDCTYVHTSPAKFTARTAGILFEICIEISRRTSVCPLRPSLASKRSTLTVFEQVSSLFSALHEIFTRHTITLVRAALIHPLTTSGHSTSPHTSWNRARHNFAFVCQCNSLTN